MSLMGERSTSSKGRVLVVEDEAAIRQLIETVLEAKGFDVSACSDVEAAVAELASGAAFDALLLDASLAQPDATRLGAALGDVPVVLTSGHAEGRARQGLEGLSIAAFLPKPFRPAQLASTIVGVVRGSAPG